MLRIATVAVPALASMGDGTQIELFLINCPRKARQVEPLSKVWTFLWQILPMSMTLKFVSQFSN